MVKLRVEFRRATHAAQRARTRKCTRSVRWR
jgi:hypothetical protein